MLYSSACEHALRALTYLAQRPPGRMAFLAEIAEAQALPAPSLAEVLQDLVGAGLLRRAGGPTGGYRLAYPAEEISLLRVKEVMDGAGDLERCVVGIDPCSDAAPCPLHESFKPIRNALRGWLSETSVRDLALGTWEKETTLARRRRPHRQAAAAPGSAGKASEVG